jgi:hypothetical protein
LNNFVIPEEINGKPVLEIGWNAFKDKHIINSNLVIPDSIQIIREYAFKDAFT